MILFDRKHDFFAFKNRDGVQTSRIVYKFNPDVQDIPNFKSFSDGHYIIQLYGTKDNYMKIEKVSEEYIRSLPDRTTVTMTVDTVPEPRTCIQCGKPATKRCSKCKIAKYCGTECQKAHWSQHKESCKQVQAAQAALTTQATQSSQSSQSSPAFAPPQNGPLM